MKHYSSALPTLALTVIQKEGPRWTWEEGPTSAWRPLLTPVARGDLLQYYSPTGLRGVKQTLQSALCEITTENCFGLFYPQSILNQAT